MRIPPRISTGAASPHDASPRLDQNGSRGSPVSLLPKPCRRDIQTAGTISASPARIPGIMPAANIAGTDAPGTITL